MNTNYSASTRKDLEPQTPNIMSRTMIVSRIMDATKRSKIAVFESVNPKTGTKAFECYHADIYYTAQRIKNNDRHYIGSYYGKAGAKSLSDTIKLGWQ
jgi:hypothetical protein